MCFSLEVFGNFVFIDRVRLVLFGRYRIIGHAAPKKEKIFYKNRRTEPFPARKKSPFGRMEGLCEAKRNRIDCG